MKPINSHTFRGKRWHIENVPRGSAHDGMAQGPHVVGKQMFLKVNNTTRRGMEIVIHEGLHACLWDLDEEAVSETARDITALLWRMGWRKVQ